MATNRTTRFPIPKNELYYWDDADKLMKPLVGTNGAMGTNIRSSDIALPVDVQYSALKAVSEELLKGGAVRNTSRNWLITGQDWSGYKNSVLRVSNTHNQAVTLEFHIQDVGIMSKIDGTPYTITIPANVTNVIVNSATLPILGEAIADQIAIAFISSVAPTSGSIEVIASFTPLI